MNSVMTTFKWKKTDDMQIFVEESTKELADIFVTYKSKGDLVTKYWKQITNKSQNTILLKELFEKYSDKKKLHILFRMKKQEVLLNDGSLYRIPFWGHTVVVSGKKCKSIEIFD